MKSIVGRLSLSFFIAVFCLSLLPNFTFAQDLDDVTITGKVTDANGGNVVGATVTAIQVDQKVERSTTTDANGRYRIIELVPGKYSIKVSASGFGIETKTDLDTVSGQSVKIDFSLVPADVRAEQTVSIDDTDAPLIDVTKTVVGGTITAEQLEELPNTSNDVLDLVFTLGGTSEESFSIRNLTDGDRIGGGSERDQPSGVTGAGSISLAGGAAYSTNITIDGLDNNDDRGAEERFQPPIDSVAEIQVIANQFSAEYGRASGGRINIRTKAGARKFRGRFFMFFEDDNLNANTYNNNRRGLSRLPFREYAPGGTLSGPVPFWKFKDKTYFFSSYAYQDRDATTLIDTALPLQQNPLYPLPGPTNPGDARVDDVPNPTFDTFEAVQIATFNQQVKTPTKRHRFTQRVDHNFTDTHNMTFNYQLGRGLNFRQYRETTRFLPESIQGRTRDNDSFYITDNYVVNSKFVNQLRFQYSSYRPDFATRATDAPVVLLFVSDDSRAGSDDQVRGTVVIGNSTSNATLREETRYQIQETANYLVGDQTFRFGFDYQRIQSDNIDLRDSTGTYNFWRVANFLTNEPSRYRRNFGADSFQRNNYFGTFLQHDWRVKNNLTLSLGLRYERETLVKDNNNFGPRVAVAYSPGSDSKSVIRIGGGIFYNRVLLRTLDDYSLGQTTVRFDSENLDGPSNESRCLSQVNPGTNATTDKCRFLFALAQQFPTAPTLADLQGLETSLGLTSTGFDNQTNFSRQIEDGIKIPESYQFNVGYERDLGNAFAFETNFTYNKAVRLWRETNINAFRIPDGFNTYTDFLLSLGTFDLRGTMTRFELGDPTDDTGVAVDGNGVRVVNLRTLNSSEAQSAPIGISYDALEDDIRSAKPNPALGQLEQVGDIGQSVYKGLSFELKRRLRPVGFGFRSSMRFVYTIASAKDDGFVDTSSAQVAGDFKNEFSRSSIDRRHKFRFSGTIETPKMLGKIRMSPLIRIESGRPFNVSIGGQDRNLDDVSNDRPNYTGDLSRIVYTEPGSPFPQALADSFSLATIGTPGNLPRNAGRGTKLYIFDLNLSRQFKINERIRIRPQASFDNILNANVFSFGSDFINLSQAGTSEFEQGFLVPSRTLRHRQIQFGVRVDF